MVEIRKEAKESMTVSWAGGVQLAVEMRGHRVLVDQPVSNGGQDEGITPVEMFVASLGTCMGYFAVKFFERHKIQPGGLKLKVEWDYAEQPHRVGEITVRVDLPAKLDTGTQDRLQKVLEGCTVHQSLTRSPRIAVLLK